MKTLDMTGEIERSQPQEPSGFLARIFHLPETLFGLMKRRRKKRSPLSSLYIMEVNFEIRPDSEAEKALKEQRAYLFEKYGIDLFIVEPGYKLKRFEDI